MDRNQLAIVKEEIKASYKAKIDKLTEEMNAAIASLSQVEHTLFETTDVEITKPKPMLIRRSPRAVSTTKPLSVSSRLKAALREMDGDFTRKDLFEKIKDDGGEIAKGTRSAEFSRLLKKEFVIETRKPIGTAPGLYRKTNKVDIEAQTSQAEEVN